MSAEPTPAADTSYTIDELAAVTGMTVRTTRYYAGLGLLAPPVRRGRVAYYDEQHRARLELIRALQDHGFTLAAIERYLGRIPLDASAEDIAVQRSMLTAWIAGPVDVVTRRELDQRAGRRLTSEQIEVLQRIEAIRPSGAKWELLPTFEVAAKVVTLGIPLDSVIEATDAIGAHMERLADELTEITQRRVLAPYRQAAHTPEEKRHFEETFARLRQLTLEAVVAGFQRAADQVITRSLEA